MQQLNANIIINIPETHVLVEKVEFDELKQRGEPEWVTGLQWLSDQTGIRSPQQLKSKILYPFKNELINFVEYPKNSGELWRFNTFFMKKWLRENFNKVAK